MDFTFIEKLPISIGWNLIWYQSQISLNVSFLVPIWVLVPINLLWNDYIPQLISPHGFKAARERKC